MSSGHVAVIDIGKTNAKLALVDISDLSEVAVITRPNTVLAGPPWPHFDTEGHWRFLLQGLVDFHAQYGINAITVTTHGACAALLAQDGTLAVPILDYEFTGPDDLACEYDKIRPDFAETGSPRLSGGLNIGAQLHWQFANDPGLRNRVKNIVTYPQYWGFRLTGVAATDVTSLGCHTDLWNPHKGEFSSLVPALGLSGKLAPPHKPDAVLGTILPQIAEQTGLPKDTQVLCGLHDSNASLLPHVLGNVPPFSVVSTGTWVIAMAIGGKDVALDPDKDVLINVNAMGQPVPSARFMGGREHDLATAGRYPDPSENDLRAVLEDQVMLLPSLTPETGPFRGQITQWHGPEPKPGSARRGAVVALYLAMVTAECLKNIGHSGHIIVEGPFSSNRIFLRMLAATTGSPVRPSHGVTGTAQGAAMLASPSACEAVPKVGAVEARDQAFENMHSYAAVWKEQVLKRGA